MRSDAFLTSNPTGLARDPEPMVAMNLGTPLVGQKNPPEGVEHGVSAGPGGGGGGGGGRSWGSGKRKASVPESMNALKWWPARSVGVWKLVVGIVRIVLPPRTIGSLRGAAVPIPSMREP